MLHGDKKIRIEIFLSLQNSSTEFTLLTDKPKVHLSAMSCLNLRWYLTGFNQTKQMLCVDPWGLLWRGGGGDGRGWSSDSDVPPYISQSLWHGDKAKSPDGISAEPQIGSEHAASHLCHLSSQMKYKRENGQWVMEIDSKETWVVINMVPCAAKQHKTPAPPTAYLRLELGAVMLPVCNLWWRCHSQNDTPQLSEPGS